MVVSEKFVKTVGLIGAAANWTIPIAVRRTSLLFVRLGCVLQLSLVCRAVLGLCVEQYFPGLTMIFAAILTVRRPSHL